MPTFYVGEQPSTPLVITVRDQAGAALDLSGVSSVEMVGDPLPAGNCAVINAALGKVQYDFDEPFATSGSLVEQVAMFSGTGIDYSAPFTLTVADLTEAAGLRLTPTQVESMTGASVSENDIARAQGVISVAAGINPLDEEWRAWLSPADAYWLDLAIAYQATEAANVQAGLDIFGVTGATSVANGDVRITFRQDADRTLPELGSLARSALMRLSWLRPMRSIQAKPFIDRKYPVSTRMWHTITNTSRWPY